MTDLVFRQKNQVVKLILAGNEVGLRQLIPYQVNLITQNQLEVLPTFIVRILCAPFIDMLECFHVRAKHIVICYCDSLKSNFMSMINQGFSLIDAVKVSGYYYNQYDCVIQYNSLVSFPPLIYFFNTTIK